jgi:tryptophan synthase beta subunit
MRDVAKKIRELEKLGYKVKKDIPTVKKTFEVPVELLEQFMTKVKAKNMKVKDAIAEALKNWLE